MGVSSQLSQKGIREVSSWYNFISYHDHLVFTCEILGSINSFEKYIEIILNWAFYISPSTFKNEYITLNYYSIKAFLQLLI